MMTFAQISTATLDQLTDELAAAGWDSTQTDIHDAREAVARLLCEVKTTNDAMTELDDASFPSTQDWENGVTTWAIADGLSIRVEGPSVEVIS